MGPAKYEGASGRTAVSSCLGLLVLCAGVACVDIDGLRENETCELTDTLVCAEGADAGTQGGGGERCTPDPCADLPGRVCDPQSGRCLCEHACDALEETRCVDGSLSVCRADEAGCRTWTALLDCAGGCGDGFSCSGCDNACPRPGEGVCEGTQLRLCSADAQGCLGFGVLISCDDGVGCTTDRCDAELGACDNTPDDSLCTSNRDNVCARDYCDVELGCAVEPVDAPCDDGDPCTLGDHCDGGACVGGLDPQGEGCEDLCPDDPNKIDPGICGCGVVDSSADRDEDGIVDCQDRCPDDACDAEGFRCGGFTLFECALDPDGCFAETSTTCESQFCIDGSNCGRHDVFNWEDGEDVSPQALAIDFNGNAYVASDARGSVDGNPVAAGSHRDVVITKWSADGQRLWSSQWGDEQDESPTDVAVDPFGNMVAAVGELDPPWDGQGEPPDPIMWLGAWSTDARGQPLWTLRFEVAGVAVEPRALTFGPEGAIYVVAMVDGAVDDQPAGGALDGVLMRFDSTGTGLVWARQWGGAADDEARAVVSDGSSLYVAGRRRETSAGASLALVAKYSPEGERLWEQTWNERDFNWFDALAVGPDGDLIASGAAIPAGGLTGGLLVKLAAQDGVEIWLEASSVVGGADALAIDSAGTLYSGFHDRIEVLEAGSEAARSIRILFGTLADFVVTGSPPGSLAIYTTGFDPAGGGAFFAISRAE